MYHKEFMAENFPDAVIESKDLTVETFKEELSDSARYVAKATFTKRNFLDGFYSRFAILFIGGLLFLVALLCCFLDEPLIASIPVVILVIYLLVGLILKKSIKGKQDSEID